MLRITLALYLVLLASMIKAEPPPVPEGGISYYQQGVCVDKETHQRGYCYWGHDKDQAVYTTFWQENVLMFIRKATGATTYEVVWVNPYYNSY